MCTMSASLCLEGWQCIPLLLLPAGSSCARQGLASPGCTEAIRLQHLGGATWLPGVGCVTSSGAGNRPNTESGREQ